MKGAAVGASAADLSFLTSLVGAAPGTAASKNTLPGAPEAEWTFAGGQMDDSIEGFSETSGLRRASFSLSSVPAVTVREAEIGGGLWGQCGHEQEG